MKLNKIATLIALAVVSTTTALAQNIKTEAAQFEAVRLPSEPLEGMKMYNITVQTPYPENNDNLIETAKRKYEEDVANYDNTVAEAEAKHEENLARYDEEVEQARENYSLEMEQWNKMSKIERLAMQDDMPKLKLPNKPIYRKPAEPVYREPNLGNSIVFDTKVLASSYINIHGFEAGEENAITGTIVFYDFEQLDPVRKSETTRVYNKSTGKYENRTTYYYITEYKRPVELNLSYNGQSLHAGLFETSGEMISMRTDGSPNMRNKEKETISEWLTKINEYLNDKYGFAPVTHQVSVGYVKNKNGEFDDLEEAKTFAISGYNNFKDGGENSDLVSAIETWNKALGESDLEDKKARVNAKVTEMILNNLIDANHYLGNIDAALAAIDQMNNLKLTSSEKAMVQQKRDAIVNTKSRMEANGKL